MRDDESPCTHAADLHFSSSAEYRSIAVSVEEQSTINYVLCAYLSRMAKLTQSAIVVGGNAVSAFLSWRLSATNACDVTLVWKSGFENVSQYGISFRYETASHDSHWWPN